MEGEVRFSVRQLMLTGTFVAVSVVALLNANYFLVAALRVIIALALAVAIVAAIYADGKWRAFSVGFAIVGWIHFLSGAFDNLRPFNRGVSQESLAWLHVLVASRNSAGVERPIFVCFVIVIHCILTALLALLGGYVATRLDSRRQPPVYRAK